MTEEVLCRGCNRLKDEDEMRRDPDCDEQRCPDCIEWGREMIMQSVRDALEDA